MLQHDFNRIIIRVIVKGGGEAGMFIFDVDPEKELSDEIKGCMDVARNNNEGCGIMSCNGELKGFVGTVTISQSRALRG